MKKIIFLGFILQTITLYATAQQFNTDIVKLSHQRDSLLKLPSDIKTIKLLDSIGALIMYHADYTYYSHALKVAEDSLGVEWMRDYNIERLGGMRYYPWFKVKNGKYLRAFKDQMYYRATWILIKYQRFHLRELQLIQLPHYHGGLCFQLKNYIIEAGGKWDRDYDCIEEEEEEKKD